MNWLTWRQFRAQALVASAVLAASAMFLAVSGLGLSHLYDRSGVTGCQTDGACAKAASAFLSSLKVANGGDTVYWLGIAALYVTPALIGVFWGAPLISRELETGTFRLAWNQSVTRNRWLATKLAVVGLSAMATAGLLSLMVTWWAEPIQRAVTIARSTEVLTNRFGPILFGARGITPIGYAAFAFALGVTVGVLVRRALPAMAVTLAVFAAIQVATVLEVRPHLMAPSSTVTAIDAGSIDGLMITGDHMTVMASTRLPGALVISTRTIDAAGNAFSGAPPAICKDPSASAQQCFDAIGDMRLRQLVQYQPASRYWTFQWLESGIYLGLAAMQAGFCFWWVKRRVGR